MLSMKYALPKNEVEEDDGRIVKTTETVEYKDTNTEIVADELRKLMAQGYEVAISVKLKYPKD